MIRYQCTAAAFKLASLNSMTRRMYRRLGNIIGPSRHSLTRPVDVQRALWMLMQWRSNRLQSKETYLALELGTGWKNFFGLSLHLFENISLTLYDVWDNRQFSAVLPSFESLVEQISHEKELTREDVSRALKAIEKMRSASDFEHLYEMINAEYIIDSAGRLDRFPDNRYDLVFSMDVLEHVPASSIAQSINEYYRVLKPGGVSLHQIGVDDHLTHYDSNASKKQYLAYDEWEWRMRFENRVQYFNCVSMDQFRSIFLGAGFEEIQFRAERSPSVLSNIRVADRYRSQSQESLEATRIYAIHRKPL